MQKIINGKAMSISQPKTIAKLIQLAEADRLIQDPNFAATHAAIAVKLSISYRTARRLIDELRDLGAPLHSPGDGWGGWEYHGAWIFQDVILKAIAPTQ